MSKTQSSDTEVTRKHTPVMVSEILRVLQPEVGESFLDLTAGYGGHAQAVIDQTKTPDGTVLVDRDADAILALQSRFAHQSVQIIHEDFLSAIKSMVGSGKRFDMILADLGISSPHLEQADRGFSIQKPAILDMRMDRRQELTANTIVNTWPEDRLVSVIREFGQEPKARRIARRIVRNRPINSTDRLAAIISPIWPGRSKIHPASRTFQALRIAVNGELTQLEQSLPLCSQLLAPGGRLAIISFHSLEDRIVKRFFSELASGGYDAELTLLTKKPLSPSQNEIVSNPRARSAKLRAVAKIKNK